MKKSLLLSAAAIAAACAVNAQDVPGVKVWDFNTHGIFSLFQDPDAMEYRSGNYDFIDKNGATVNTDKESMVTAIKTPAEESETGAAYNTNYGKNNRIISFYDGMTYLMHEAAADDEVAAENGYEVFPGSDPEAANHPFFGWAQAGEDGKSLGPCRTLWMPGWGTEDAWEDRDYNAIDEANWVATKHAISLQRCGQGEGSIEGYIQFPEVELPCKVTYYVGSAGGKYAPNLLVNMQAIQNGTETDLMKVTDDADFTIKRFYKKEVTFNGTGKASFRIWAKKREIHVYHVVFDSNYDGENADYALDFGAVENVNIDNINAVNAPAYNVYGQRVDVKNYKGIVIQNGKKFILK
ncbi:MAG: hypothetical protein K2N91_06045 [Muribaculaceae bacterium]|nr:hypothetical protein [Muribaculaceae bacterium]